MDNTTTTTTTIRQKYLWSGKNNMQRFWKEKNSIKKKKFEHKSDNITMITMITMINSTFITILYVKKTQHPITEITLCILDRLLECPLSMQFA